MCLRAMWTGCVRTSSASDRLAEEMGARFEPEVDSIYLGGGTPTVLDPAELERMFAAVRAKFRVRPAMPRSRWSARPAR